MKITKQGVDFFYFALLISINEIGAITNSVPNKKSKEKKPKQGRSQHRSLQKFKVESGAQEE